MKHYDVDDLVRSLIGKDLGAILSGLQTAAGAYDAWLNLSTQQRDMVTGAAAYADFAKAARWYLVDAPGTPPSNAERVRFGRIRPLLEDMVARGLAPKAAAEWLQRSAEQGD